MSGKSNTSLSLIKSVTTTICYRDVFSYPLTTKEIIQWLILPPSLHVAEQKVERVLQSLQKKRWIIHKDGYWMRAGRTSFGQLRDYRADVSRYKWSIAYQVGNILKLIPTIALVGVTGGLSMDNTDQHDDVDVLVVSYPHVLWITRFLTVLFVEIVAKRRTPGLKRTGDSICLNMFMTTDDLSISSEKKDLYVAHEMLQMVPLWSKDHTYQKMLRSNTWVKSMLPFMYALRLSYAKTIPQQPYKYLYLWYPLFWILDHPARVFQRWYMRSKHTTEVVRDSRLEFHPRDARSWIKKKFSYLLKRYGVPLDKVWSYSLQ